METNEKITNWIEQGKELIYPERHTLWEKIVINNENIFNGLLIENTLEILTALENEATINEAILLFNNQNHSERTAVSVIKWIFKISSKGPEFFLANVPEEITDKYLKEIKEQKIENEQLSQKYQKQRKKL